jgi:hypothetical protein
MAEAEAVMAIDENAGVSARLAHERSAASGWLPLARDYATGRKSRKSVVFMPAGGENRCRASLLPAPPAALW